MNTSDVVYDACRAYVIENVEWLEESTYLRINGMIRARDFRGLATLREGIDFSNISVDTHRVLMQVESFFRKNADFADDVLCTEAARASFIDSELRCHYTNERFDAYASDAIDEDLLGLYDRARRWIAEVLGPLDDFLEVLPQLVKLTGGATSATPRSLSQPVRKIGRLGVCTPSAWPYIHACYRHVGFSHDEIPGPKLTQRNRVTVVPKDWKTHRSIAAEPAGNLPLQLAFDAFGKRRLSSRTDIDLTDQSGNRDLARLGSLEDGTWCTVDLSAASDSIAINLVGFLLPDDWFCFLNDIRSPGFTGAFGDGVYEKFSSMGNGTTFVVETLIFASLCHAVGAKQFLVYGDDIVIDRRFVDALFDLLDDAGFRVNERKSFWSGPFRESCGGNYHAGFDITPFHWRQTPTARAEWCHVVNGLARIAAPQGPLASLARKLTKELRLPLGPFATSTTCWVHIDASTAYDVGLIKSDVHTFGCRVSGYVSRAAHESSVHVLTLRKLFRWYFRKLESPVQLVEWDGLPLLGRRGFLSPLLYVQTSREPATSAPKGYRKRWVSWYPPAQVAPLHLYWWSDWLVRES